MFGDRWPLVKRVMSEFRRMGIHLADVHKRNINFGDDDTAADPDS